MRQRTLRRPVRASGIGLHSGRPVYLALRPAPPDSGVVFARMDLDPPVAIRAGVEAVVDTQRATTLGTGEVRVATVEHLLSALCALGVDNVRVDVSAPELPIMDGSAAPFVQLLLGAGIVEQPAAKRFLRVLERLVHADGDAWTTLEPYDGCRLDYTLAYDHPYFEGRSQRCVFELGEAAYVSELCRARTFGFLAEITLLKRLDLARGGSLDNALVLDDRGVMNEGGLRLPDEFAKHKILDAIGDLYLLGYPVLGAFTGHKSGHGTNLGLLRRLMETPTAWELVTLDAIRPARAGSTAGLAVS